MLIFRHGLITLVELKSPSGRGRLSAMQIHIIKELTDRNVDVQVIDSFEAFKALVQERLDAPQV